jgi:hypothetical protein
MIRKSISTVFVIAFFSSLFISHSCYAQSTFQKAYGLSGPEGAVHITPAGNNEFILTGTTQSSGSTDMSMTKVTENGTFLWSKAIGTAGSGEDGFGTHVSSSNEMYVAGYTDAGGPGSVSGNLTKTDQNGNILWSKNYGISLIEQYTSITSYGDTAFLLAGFSFQNGIDIFVTKVDTAGNIIWSRTVGNLGGAELSFDAIATSDGGALLLGITDQGAGSDDILIIKLDNTGAIQWSTLMGATVQDGVMGAVQTNSGYMLLCRSVNAQNNIVVAKLDNSGAISWANEYQKTGIEIGSSLRMINDNKFMIAGYLDGISTGNEGLSMVIDSMGNLTSAHAYGDMGAGIEHLDDVAVTSDGGYLLVGFTDAFGNGSNDIYLVRADSTGSTECNDSLITASFTVSPFSFIVNTASIVSTAAGVSQNQNLISSTVNFITDTICQCFAAEQPIFNQSGTSICAGDSALINITGGNLNDATDWFWYSTNCGGTLIGNGTSMYLSPSVTTTYFARGEAACADGVCSSITIVVNDPTTSSISPTVCNSYTSPSGNNTWTTSGTFEDTLVAGNSMGCDSIITINLTILDSTHSSISPTSCDSYISPSGTYLYTASGTFSDTLFGGNSMGCDSIISVNLTIVNVDTSVTVATPTLTSTATVATYQWLDCNNNFAPIPGETNQNFTALNNGSYAVEVTQNGCTDTSACYDIVGLESAENNFATQFKIFPNPTSGYVQLQFDAIQENLTIVVRNVTGKVVLSKQFLNINNASIEIPGAKGFYIAELSKETGERVLVKIVKN